MKKRYSEYIGYKYSMDDEWFNPQVEWDTELFIDPVLLKNIEIPEFKDSYPKIVNYFSKVLEKIEDDTIPIKLKENMVDFIEVKEANLGYSYDSNDGSGLTGKTALRLMNNLKTFIKSGLFGLEEFETIVIFNNNVDKDRISDMTLNILKNNFIEYSINIAKKNKFPIKKFRQRTEFNFGTMSWNIKNVDMPYIINEEGKEIPVLLIPKIILVSKLNYEEENFLDWLYDNQSEFLKEKFDYNIKKDLYKIKDEIKDNIIKNNRKDIVDKFIKENENISYDINKDPEIINNIYEIANDMYNQNKDSFEKINRKPESIPVAKVVEILLEDLRHLMEDKKGYISVFSSKNKFLSEPKISKIVHMIWDARIKDSGFDVDISPESNAGRGPVDFKISRGEDKVLVENKVSTNPKLLECINENKQIHIYLKQEDCKLAYLLVFINKESDIVKINELNKKASELRKEYTINIKYIDCIEKESASKA